MGDLPTVNSTYTRLYNNQQDKFEIFQVRSSGFLRIFTVAFFLFLNPAGALTLQGYFFNHAGHSLTLT